MIAKGKGCSYGAELTNYITKNERADIIHTNLLNKGTTPFAMWNEMQIHFNRYKAQFGNRQVTTPAVRFELSPSAEECKDWTDADWQKFIIDFLFILDNMTDFTNVKGIKRHLKKTNFSNTQLFAGLHRDSKSGHLHLHGLTNRLDKDGKLNDIHHFGERLVAAAQEMNRQRGWKDAMEIRKEHLNFYFDECMTVLKEMPRFSLDDYFNRLRQRGHELRCPPDSKGVVHGYSFKQPGTTDKHYKASELGEFQEKGNKRVLTVKMLESTWNKLHADELQMQGAPGRTATGQHVLKTLGKQNTGTWGNRTPAIGTTDRGNNSESVRVKNIKVNDKTYPIAITNSQYNELANAIEIGNDCAGTFIQVLHTASLLFMGYVDAATTFAQSYGGGGGGDTGGWRDKDDDEDWKRYIQRCAREAQSMARKPAKMQSHTQNQAPTPSRSSYKRKGR